MKRNINLILTPPEEALELFLSSVSGSCFPGVETAPVRDALGRVTARAVYARISSPHFHAAAMDGFAVQAKDTFGASQENPATFTRSENAWAINTGHPIPDGTDAVIMIEDVEFVSDDRFEIRKALSQWKNVRRVGEDFVASEMILPARHRIDPYEQGALVAGGIYDVEVVQKPKVTIIPTGSELIPAETLRERAPKPGETLEYNAIMLAGLVEQAGARAEVLPIVADEFDIVKQTILDGVNSDANLVVIIAGSSAGSRDYTAAAIREIGEVLVHGVAMMPGKPTILGVVRGKPVIGNPGYPVSSVLSFELFGLPMIAAMQGVAPSVRPTIDAINERAIRSKADKVEFARVKLGKVGDRSVAVPMPKGAGSITSLTRADGILRVGSGIEVVEAGSVPRIELLRDPEAIQRTVIVSGGHDLTLDIIADELGARNVRLCSSNGGDSGGLFALKNRTAHIATPCLFDAETGKRSRSLIRELIPEVPIRIFRCVTREQGLIVAKGNPKSVHGFQDLARRDVNFVNRRRGSSTRALIDGNLKRLRMDPNSIRGYEIEERTHASVAAAVQSGVADVGMGVFAAAKALGLDFAPVVVDEYDLVIPEEFLSEEKIQAVLDVIRSAPFKERVASLGGYSAENSGEEIAGP